MFAHNGYFEIDILAPKGHVIHASRHARRTIAYTGESELGESLLQVLQANEYAGIHCIDESSRNLVLRHCGEPLLQPYLPFPVDSPLNESSCDKVSFYRWCVENSLPVPRSLVAGNAEALPIVAQEMGYPFILKGALGSRGSTVSLIETEAQLVAASAKYPDMPAWLLQEYLVGPAGTTSLVCRQGKVYTTCSSYKTVTLDGGFGTSAVKEFVRSDELDELAEVVAKATQVNGATGYDWMLNSAGRVLMIDPHFGRGPSSMIISHLDGVDIDEALYMSLTDGPCVTRKASVSAFVWIFPQCLSLFFEGRITEAWRAANPLRRDVSVFLYGGGESVLFFKQVCPIVCGKLRVLAGAIKAKVLGSSSA